MEGKLQLRIEYLDGTFYAEEIGVSWPVGQEATACMKLLADAPDGRRYIVETNWWFPQRKIDIQASEIVTGDLVDLARLTPPAPGAGRIIP